MAALSLLTSIFNSAFASYEFMVSFVVLIVAIIFNATIAVIEFQLSRIVIALLLSGQLLYLVVKMGLVYEYGMEIRQTLKNLTLPKAMKKPWMGWRAPRIAVGEFLYVHRGIPLAVLSVLLNTTASLIIEIRIST